MFRALSLSRLRWLAAGGLITLASGAGLAQEPGKLPVPKAAPVPAPAPAKESSFATNPNAITRYTLGEALAIAHARHPQLSALKASMNAAMLKGRGLGEVKRMIGFLSPDIDSREKQSDLGLKAAMAEYDQAQHEVTYAVIHCYYTVVYARLQGTVARDLVEQLDSNVEYVRKIVEDKNAGVKGINLNTLSTLKVVASEARLRLIQAETGLERARAILREAMGLEPGARVDAADEVLPEIKVELNRDVLIAHAVTRRGEVLLSQIGADVSRLEVCAQEARRLNLMATTYANAGDIHARPIPGATRDPDYKPGMIGPEMPDRLLGNKKTRVETAGQYAVRSLEASRQARSLIGLEAHVGYTRWIEASEQVKYAREGAKEGRALIERLREAAGAAPTKEETITAELASARASASFNQALYDQIMALCNLERITAGGIKVNYVGR